MKTFFASSRRAPTATFHDSKHNIVHVHFDATRGWLLTSGTDKVIKVGRHLILGVFHLWSCVNTQEHQGCMKSAQVTLGSEHFWQPITYKTPCQALAVHSTSLVPTQAFQWLMCLYSLLAGLTFPVAMFMFLRFVLYFLMGRYYFTDFEVVNIVFSCLLHWKSHLNSLVRSVIINTILF